MPPPTPQRPETPRRSTCVQIVTLAVMFLGGGLAGTLLSSQLVSNSQLATIIGLFTFPLAFFVSMSLWLTSAAIIDVWRFVRRTPTAAPATQVAPGSVLFLPTALLIAALSGGLMGLLGSTLGFWGTAALYALLGALYGGVCWQLANRGYLPLLIK